MSTNDQDGTSTAPADSAADQGAFARVGAWCHDRRKWVLIGWIVILFVGFGIQGAGGEFRNQGSLPDIEAKHGLDILDDQFGGQGGGFNGTIVFKTDRGVEDPAVKQAMERWFRKVGKIEGILRVVSPYSKEGAQQISPNPKTAGKIAYATVEFPQDADFEDAAKIRDEILHAEPKLAGVQTELGGQVFADFENPSSEALGIAVAIVILIAAFGSVLAMGLPIGTSIFGIATGGAITVLISHVMSVPSFATFLGVMIGLGVGIDYALLIITRYREQLHAGHDVRESLVIAMDTAGRSVLFAGTTVVISLGGMFLMGVSFVQGLAVSASATVAVTVAASLTLLPALLGFAKGRVELTRRRGLIAAGLMAVALVGVGLKITALLVCIPLAVIVLIAGIWVPWLKKEVPHRPPKPLRQTAAYRWSRLIQHHPWAAAGVGALVLLLLAIPILSLRLGFSDESNYAKSTSTRKAYDLTVQGFGAGFNGPLILVAEVPKGTTVDDLAGVQAAVAKDADVVFASPAQLSTSGAAARWFVVPKTGPQDKATTDAVKRLRNDTLPPAERAAGIDVKITGPVAINIDFASFLTRRLPYFFGAVLLLSFVLLMVVFRSLLVPLKAVIMNLLSIGASYGIAVALFQWGWLSSVTGVSPAPIEPWIPMMLFAIVFGLSMDYEVFLLSRVQEEWHRTGDSRTSVADGLAATAKVITAAAAIMVFVFGAFLLENDRVVKLMGTGLATAILLDATIVRMLLVPATMELLGDKNWWLPKWLDRILPKIDVEGHHIAAPIDAGRDDDEDPTPDRELVPVGS